MVPWLCKGCQSLFCQGVAAFCTCPPVVLACQFLYHVLATSLRSGSTTRTLSFLCGRWTTPEAARTLPPPSRPTTVQGACRPYFLHGSVDYRARASQGLAWKQDVWGNLQHWLPSTVRWREKRKGCICARCFRV